jgi:hypothetical protein
LPIKKNTDNLDTRQILHTAAFNVDLDVGQKFVFRLTVDWRCLTHVIPMVRVSQIFYDELKAVQARGSDDPMLPVTPF